MKNYIFIIPILLVMFSCNIGPAKKQPIAVLTFDDAEISHYNNVAPLLKEYGFGATFFVCEFPHKEPGDSLKYMTWDQIAELHQMGFEIGNHTRTHKHVDRMKRPEMEAELSYIEDKCQKYNIPKPVSFAYPGYDVNPRAFVVLRDMGYTFGRVGGSEKYDVTLNSKLMIPSFSTTGTKTKAFDRVMNVLKNTKPGDIAVFTIHGVPDSAHPHVSTSLEFFKQYLQYMKDHDFKVIAMRDLEQFQIK